MRSKNLRKRSLVKARQGAGSGSVSARSGQNSSLSTTADSTGVVGNKYHNLNLSDIESDDSFECEDELITQGQMEEDDDESIIVSANQEQTLENVLEMHD